MVPNVDSGSGSITKAVKSSLVDQREKRVRCSSVIVSSKSSVKCMDHQSKASQFIAQEVTLPQEPMGERQGAEEKPRQDTAYPFCFRPETRYRLVKGLAVQGCRKDQADSFQNTNTE